MQEYKELARELIEQHIKDVKAYQETDKQASKQSRREILEALIEDTEDVFGNLSGSRTCSIYQAEQFINKSNALFDDEIAELFEQISDTYKAETLARGAETFDVVVLELLSPQVINEMLEAEA